MVTALQVVRTDTFAWPTMLAVIVVLGGLGNPTGALLGGIVIGLLEGVSTVFIPVSWVPVLEYVIFILILLLRE